MELMTGGLEFYEDQPVDLVFYDPPDIFSITEETHILTRETADLLEEFWLNRQAYDTYIDADNNDQNDPKLPKP